MGYFDKILDKQGEVEEKRRGYFDEILKEKNTTAKENTKKQSRVPVQSLSSTATNNRPYIDIPQQKRNIGATGSWDSSESDRSLDEAIVDAGKNFIPSFKRYFVSLYETIRHPSNTIDAISSVVAEAASKAAGHEIPAPTLQAIKKMALDRYGGWQNIKNTLAEDPVGFASDLSSIVGLAVAPVRAAAFSSKAVGATKTAANLYKTVEKGTRLSTVLDPLGATKIVTNPVTKAVFSSKPAVKAKSWLYDAAAGWSDNYMSRVDRADRANIAKTGMDEYVVPSKRIGPDRIRSLMNDEQFDMDRGAMTLKRSLRAQVNEQLQAAKNSGKSIDVHDVYNKFVDELSNPETAKTKSSEFYNTARKTLEDELSAYVVDQKLGPRGQIKSYSLDDITKLDKETGKYRLRTSPEEIKVPIPTGKFTKSGKMIYRIEKRNMPYVSGKLDPFESQSKKNFMQSHSKYQDPDQGPLAPSHKKDEMKKYANAWRSAIESITEVKTPNARMNALHDLEDMISSYAGRHKFSLSPKDLFVSAIAGKRTLSRLSFILNDLGRYGLKLSPNGVLIRSGLIKINQAGKYVDGQLDIAGLEKDSNLGWAAQQTSLYAAEKIGDVVKKVIPQKDSKK